MADDKATAAKGTVTSLASMFPPDEAQKASERVQSTIAERQQQLEQLKGFISDNANLINLVQKLPDQLHHDIMVPFGKAAFFPGRLIHTNEFMVLLGEGYYAERTSKQAVEILKRREKALDTQVESLKAIMQDLKAEASFFDATASESAEGLVEIREEYVEEGSYEAASTTGSLVSQSSRFPKSEATKVSADDEEYERIFSRIDELEKEEEAEAEAENADGSVEDEQIEDNLVQSISHISIDQEARNLKMMPDKALNKELISEGSPKGKNPAVNKIDKVPELPEIKEKAQTPLNASSKALIGSIVEHNYGGVNSKDQQTGGRSSKPVSRFKMQRK